MWHSVFSFFTTIAKATVKPIMNRVKQAPIIRRKLNDLNIDRVTALNTFDDIYQRTYAEFEKDKPSGLREFFWNPEVKKIFREAFAARDRAYFYEQTGKQVAHKIERVAENLDYDPRRGYDSFCRIFDQLVKESRTPWQETQEYIARDTQTLLSGIDHTLSGMYQKQQTERELSIPFITATEYFAPWLNKKNHFNHLLTLIGREDYLNRMKELVLDSSLSILALTGRGGLGKSKILYDYSLRNESTHRKIRFVSETIPLKPEHFAVLMNGEYLIILDDAHKYDNDSLKLLLSFARKSSGRVKLILSSRPQGKDFIQFFLSEAGYSPQEFQFLPELSDLTLDEVRAIASQVLGSDLEYLADRIAYLTQDCPLVTVVGSKLLRDRAVDPALLEQDEDFIYTVLHKFRDERVGRISERVDEKSCKLVLNLLSAVSPVRVDNPEFVDRVVKFIDIPDLEFESIIDELEASGLLLRRGWSYRITPDVLSDHILNQACISRNGTVNQYASKVYQHFSDICGEQVLRNLSELDWRMTVVRKQGTRLLDEIWYDIEKNFKAGGIRERIQLLEQIQRVAYYQPKRALALAEFALHNPLPDESFYWTQQHVLDEVAVVLKNVGYTIDYLPHALDLLWEIGRNDGRKTNSNPQHGMRILTDIASYSRNKGIFVQEIVLDAVERWLTKPDAYDHLHSPLEVLKTVFSKVGEDTYSEEWQVVITAFLINEETTRGIRHRAIEILKSCMGSNNQKVAIPAVRVMGEALQKPFPIMNLEIPDDYIQVWEPQALSILNSFMERILRDPDPYVCIAICEAVSWHAQYNSEEPIVMKKAQEVISSVPINFELNLIRALCYSLDKNWKDHDEDFSDMYERQQQRAIELWAIYAREYVTRKSEPREMLRELEKRLSLIRELELPNDPHLFLRKLAEVNCAYTVRMCQNLIEDKLTNMTQAFVIFLHAVRNEDPDQALSIYQEVILIEEPELRNAAARYLALTCLEKPSTKEINSLEKLFSHPDEQIVLQALTGLQWYGMSDKEYLVKTLAEFEILGRSAIASRICEIVVYDTKFEGLIDDQLKKMVQKLKEVPSLADEAIAIFLHEASKRVPECILDLYLERICYEQSHQGIGYDALPHQMYPIAVDESSDEYASMLRKVRDQALDFDLYSRWDFAKVYMQLSHGFSDVSLSILTEWIDSKEESKLCVVIELLKDAPAGFLFAKASFVSHLLESAAAISSSMHEMVVGQLIGIAQSGLRQGVPGEPFQQDIYVEEEARKNAAKFLKGSVQERFYSQLAESTRRNTEFKIKWDQETMN